MKIRRVGAWMLLMIMTVVSIGCMEAQSMITVKGKVTNAETGSSLPICNVSVYGKTDQTETDAEGVYSLQVRKGSRLIFNLSGYEIKEIQVNSDRLNVQLHPEIFIYDDILLETKVGL